MIFNRKPSLAEVLTHTAPEVLNQQDGLQQVLEHELQQALNPWYLRLLIGISAWVAALLFLIFFIVLNIIDEGFQAIFAGLCLLGISLVIQYKSEQHLFWQQLALALCLAGQVLSIAGVYTTTDSMTLSAFATLGLSLSLILFYPDSLQRLLAVQICSFSLLALFLDHELPNLIHAQVALLGAGILWCWYFEPQHQRSPRGVFLYRPLGYGMSSALLWVLLFFMSLHNQRLDVEYWFISSFSLGAMLLWLEIKLLQEHQIPLQQGPGLMILLCSVLLIGLLHQTPGLLAALLLITLGFYRQHLLLLINGLLFFPVFLSVWYYQLNWTLLDKSISLMLSGLLLLLIYAVQRAWSSKQNREQNHA